MGTCPALLQAQPALREPSLHPGLAGDRSLLWVLQPGADCIHWSCATPELLSVSTGACKAVILYLVIANYYFMQI